jgi:hypothetical protein
MRKFVIYACPEFGDTVAPQRRQRQEMTMETEDLEAIENRLAAREQELDRIFAQRNLGIRELSQIMDMLTDGKIDLAAIIMVPPGLRVRIYAWLDDYHRQLAGYFDAKC